MKEHNEFIITKDSEETIELGKKLALKFRSGDVVALYGDLGSGKTTFVQGIAKGFGITRRIISPTFIIMRSYKLRTNNELITKYLYHIDLYRIEREKEIEGIGIREIMQDKNSIVVIEWAEKIKNILPGERWEILFETISDLERKIYISHKD